MVEESNDFDTFARLLTETAERRAWTPHERSYLKAMYEFLSAKQMARLRMARLQGRPIAADMEIVFGDTVTYLHGGSSSDDRNVMAPFLLHWEAIRSAKNEGHHFYDLWGCNPDDRSSPYYKPSWEGITRFKEGWGGQKVNLVGTWDLPTNRLVYRLIFGKGLFRP
ncbi:peptidoglycan bridge formation glycyltransferase FemA/FemB family protein [Candidatus Uhrbacteria bacterium]|nr:peptidoglycan bridge formation glycyltransferase FemA/FemB family protein [Candidatus Uhrbacteria bacterium]